MGRVLVVFAGLALLGCAPNPATTYASNAGTIDCPVALTLPGDTVVPVGQPVELPIGISWKRQMPSGQCINKLRAGVSDRTQSDLVLIPVEVDWDGGVLRFTPGVVGEYSFAAEGGSVSSSLVFAAEFVRDRPTVLPRPCTDLQRLPGVWVCDQALLFDDGGLVETPGASWLSTGRRVVRLLDAGLSAPVTADSLTDGGVGAPLFSGLDALESWSASETGVTFVHGSRLLTCTFDGGCRDGGSLPIPVEILPPFSNPVGGAPLVAQLGDTAYVSQGYLSRLYCSVPLATCSTLAVAGFVAASPSDAVLWTASLTILAGATYLGFRRSVDGGWQLASALDAPRGPAWRALPLGRPLAAARLAWTKGTGVLVLNSAESKPQLEFHQNANAVVGVADQFLWSPDFDAGVTLVYASP